MFGTHIGTAMDQPLTNAMTVMSYEGWLNEGLNPQFQLDLVTLAIILLPFTRKHRQVVAADLNKIWRVYRLMYCNNNDNFLSH